jgi:hypothetical protein
MIEWAKTISRYCPFTGTNFIVFLFFRDLQDKFTLRNAYFPN